MGRSQKEQRRELERYKRKLRVGQRGGEGYMENYERQAKEYRKRVWRQANKKKKED